MADLVIAPTAHYGFQSYSTDYWLGSPNGTVRLTSNPSQWRLVPCGTTYYIQDWSTYSCLYVTSNNSLSLHNCDTAADGNWTISQNHAVDVGTFFIYGNHAISATDDAVLTTKTVPSGIAAGYPSITWSWSISEIDSDEWVVPPGGAPDLCRVTTTTSSTTSQEAAITAADFVATTDSSSTTIPTTTPSSSTTSAASSGTIASAAPATGTPAPISDGYAPRLSWASKTLVLALGLVQML